MPEEVDVMNEVVSQLGVGAIGRPFIDEMAIRNALAGDASALVKQLSEALKKPSSTTPAAPATSADSAYPRGNFTKLFIDGAH